MSKVATAPFWARIIIPTPRDGAWPCVFGQQNHCGFSLSPPCLPSEDRQCFRDLELSLNWPAVDTPSARSKWVVVGFRILRLFLIAAGPSLSWLSCDLIFSLHRNFPSQEGLPRLRNKVGYGCSPLHWGWIKERNGLCWNYSEAKANSENMWGHRIWNLTVPSSNPGTTTCAG